MSKKQPTIFWPKRRDIAALLAGTAPEGEGDYDEDGLDKTGEHWCYLDPNAIEVANAYAMGWTATIHARPTTRGIQWAIDAGEEEGLIEIEEKAMILSVLDFGDTVAREVMVPRIDIIAIDSTN